MTHEQIEEYLKDRGLDWQQYQLAIDAMAYAEQKVIGKACEWLNKELFTDKAEPNRYYDTDVKSLSYDTKEDLLFAFRKAMEE